jgi:hypothetical protein
VVLCFPTHARLAADTSQVTFKRLSPTVRHHSSCVVTRPPRLTNPPVARKDDFAEPARARMNHADLGITHSRLTLLGSHATDLSKIDSASSTQSESVRTRLSCPVASVGRLLAGDMGEY